MSLIPSIKAQAQVASNSGSGRNNQQAGIVTGIAPGKPAQISSNTGTGTNVQQLGGVIPPTGPVPDSNLPPDIKGPIPPRSSFFHYSHHLDYGYRELLYSSFIWFSQLLPL